MANRQETIRGVLHELKPHFRFKSANRVMGEIVGGGEILNFGVIDRGSHRRKRARLVFGVFSLSQNDGSTSEPCFALRVSDKGQRFKFEFIPLRSFEDIRGLAEPLAHKVVTRITSLKNKGII